MTFRIYYMVIVTWVFFKYSYILPYNKFNSHTICHRTKRPNNAFRTYTRDIMETMMHATMLPQLIFVDTYLRDTMPHRVTCHFIPIRQKILLRQVTWDGEASWFQGSLSDGRELLRRSLPGSARRGTVWREHRSESCHSLPNHTSVRRRCCAEGVSDRKVSWL